MIGIYWRVKGMLFKDKKVKLLVGYDLSDKFSQISYFYSDKDEPVTVSTVAGEEQYNIPTVLCKRREVNQWFYGKEALKQAKEKEGILVEELVGFAKKGEDVLIDGEHFDPVQLLSLFMRRSLSLLTMWTNTDKIDGLMITVDELDYTMIEVLNKITKLLGFEENQVFFQSHMESFYQFTMRQPKELWRHQVVVFDYSNEYLKSYRMEINRRTTPLVVLIDQQDFEIMMIEEIPPEEPNRSKRSAILDDRFKKIVSGLFENRMVQTVFLIGQGFNGEWCKESLKYLCKNRRVFQGNNLYSKGACYGTQEKLNENKKSSEYVYLGVDKVKANLGMLAVANGTEYYHAILDAGENWYEAKKEWDIILEQGNTLSFIITPLTGMKRQEIVMTLHDLPIRPIRTTRLRIFVEFVEEKTIKFRVKDLGFGEFFKSSELEWIEEMRLS